MKFEENLLKFNNKNHKVSTPFFILNFKTSIQRLVPYMNQAMAAHKQWKLTQQQPTQNPNNASSKIVPQKEQAKDDTESEKDFGFHPQKSDSGSEKAGII